VTGATGFIGGRLTERLVERGTRVRVLVRPGSDRRRLEKLDVEVVEGSLEDTASLRRAVHGARIIYNCTGLSTDWARWSAFEQTNVIGVKNLLDAAASAGSAERFLHLSTTDVYGYPTEACDESVAPRDVGLPYNRSKLLGEQAVLEWHKKTGLPVTVVRPVTVYGPRSKDWLVEIGKLLRTGKMMFVDDGNSRAGLLYIDNAVDGMIAAATSPRTNGQVYNLRDGSNETWREYVNALAAGMKLKPVKKSISSRMALGLARASEAVYGGLRIKSRPLLTRHAVYLMSRDQAYGIDRARQDLAFTPAVDFDAGLAASLAWLDSDEGRASVPS
jgi:nucleoside-diphosphate-sugar epimerase